MPRKKLVLIDGHSLAYRAFYGLPLYDQRGKAAFSTSKGEFTNAVYGFANTLLKVWNEEQPDYIAVAFDKGRTFRDDTYAEYKGTRDKMPDELTPQIDRIVQLVETFGIPAITADGYEADDILGTLAKRAAADGLDVLIVTGDTDAFQLIDKRIRVLTSGRAYSDTVIYDEAAIKARYGLKPIQLIDYKALKGDTSDNVPGVKGVGEKTATDLLRKYATVEGIYKRLDTVEPARAKTALEAGRDMAFLSKDLVTIRIDVPLNVTWEQCAVHTYDRSKVEALLDALEFRSIRNRLPATVTATDSTTDKRMSSAAPITGTQMSMFGEETVATQSDSARRPSISNAIVIRDESSLQSLISKLHTAKIISFDTETTGTDPLRSTLVGIALSIKEGEGYYLPVGHAQPTNQLPLSIAVQALKPIFENADWPKVAHNAKYDMAVLHQVGLDVQGVVFDTMLAEFLIDPSARLGLKALAKLRLGVEMTEIGELIGSGKKQITMAEVPIDVAAAYAAADADMTLRLMKAQEPELKAHGVRKLFDEIEMPLIPVLLDMELAGVLIDSELLKKMSKRLAKRLSQIESEVYDLVGMPFNINSPQQLADALFGKLQLKAPGGRKTFTGRVSVAADVLESMRGMHPVIGLILEHRQLSKLKSTYLDALPELVNPATGRVHTSFNQTGAVSGRVASQDPNLQNIPIRTELGREVRKAFVVPDGWKLISADYSQVELRVAAHICKDPGLRAAFKADQDIHRATAAKVLGIPPEQVTADQRSFAKRVNFGLLYGMGTRSLAEQAGIAMSEAQKFVDAYFAGFPNIRKYIDDTKRKAKEIGYVETLLGRRRSFPILRAETRDARTNVMQRAAEREAINHPIQGSAADIVKIAMIRIHEAFRQKKLKARLLLQVHDELVLEAPDAEVKTVTRLLKEIMEGAYPLDPPLKVEIGVGLNWDEVK
ncbi:MAG TPA: DNA polymerase I [Anaerolineae bacterium]